MGKEIKEKKFEILNYDELPKRGKYISWKNIKIGTVLKTKHKDYGYNEFEFIDYIPTEYNHYNLVLKYNKMEVNIEKNCFMLGGIGGILIEYKPYYSDNFIILNKLKFNGNKISWASIEKGTILKTNHIKYGYNEFRFVGNNSKKKEIYILFKDRMYNIGTNNFLMGKIGNIMGVKTGDFKVEIGQIFKEDKRNLVITDREYRKDKNGINRKYYKYNCNKCGWIEGWIEESSLKRGTGCASCSGRVVTPMNNIWNNAKWMCDLGISKEDAKKYAPQSNKKIEVTCPDCGKKKNVQIANIYYSKTISCYCGDGKSYISKYITSVLDKLNIKYQTEVKYDWNKYINPRNNKLTQASIDFVIYHNNRKIPLEADGEFHRKDNSMNGQTKEQSEYIDKQRDENCLKYLGEETIRISDEGDVKDNILNSKLNELFDLSNIDWIQVESYAIKSNKVKEVCEYWNNKEEWETTVDLGMLFGYNCSTIANYLKKGVKLGWTAYNPKEEMKKNGLNLGLYKGKAVEVFKDNVSLGIFESALNLERRSESIFGIKFASSSISLVCRNKQKHHKGYVFKYISKEECEEYLKLQEII